MNPPNAQHFRNRTETGKKKNRDSLEKFVGVNLKYNTIAFIKLDAFYTLQ